MGVWLCSIVLAKSVSYAITIDELSHISQKFILKKSISLSSALTLDSRIERVFYGHDEVGYFAAQDFSIKDAKNLVLSFVPPSYKLPIHVKVQREGSDEMIHVATLSVSSPLPNIFRRLKIQVLHGKLSQPFYLLNGALPRKVLHNPTYHSHNPELFRRNHHRFTYLMIVNRLGEVVWLHVPVIGGSLFSSYLSVKKVGEGYYGIMFGKHSGYFEIVNYTGKIEREFSSKDAKFPFVMHHDFETIGAKKLYAVGNEVKNLFRYTKNPAHRGLTFVTDTIIGIDLMQRTSQKLMGFDHIFHPGNTDYYTGDLPHDKKFVLWGKRKADVDFLHINAVDYVESQGVLVSFRNISKVSMIDTKFRHILWTLGSHPKDDYYIASRQHQFHHQHTPLMLSDNEIVLFDNAVHTKSSRVVRYRLNKEQKRAELVWEYRPNPSLFSKDRSSVYPLDNQTFGVFFVKPQMVHQKHASIPHKDIYVEVDARSGRELAKMVFTYPVASPGYRMLPLQNIGKDTLMQNAAQWRAAIPSAFTSSQSVSMKQQGAKEVSF